MKTFACSHGDKRAVVRAESEVIAQTIAAKKFKSGPRDFVRRHKVQVSEINKPNK